MPRISNKGEVYTVIRENTGMNIGSWKDGYELFDNLKYYFFFQSSSYIKDPKFAENYLNILTHNQSIGLAGDSLNTKWAHPWKELEKSGFNQKIIIQPGNYGQKPNSSKQRITQENRVDYYRNKLESWGIATQNQNATHLRALNWCTTKEVLDKIKFPLGYSYHECIAAEIAVSRAIIQAGYKISQSDQSPFKYIGHSEWEGNSKIPRKRADQASLMERLEKIMNKPKR